MNTQQGTAGETLHTALPGTPSSLKKQALYAVLAAPELRSQTARQILYWLTWLSLLSSWELARLVERDDQTTRGHLLRLEELHLVAHVVCDEPGWPPRHHRYYLTDLGLYALVAQYPEAPGRISVPKLVKSYPVTRQDLLARLARLPVHLVLSDLVSRLRAQCPQGYELTSYQQPWKEDYIAQGQRHTWTCDAAFLLTTPRGTHHAFYVRVDQPERMFGQKEEMAFLSHLLDLRTTSLLSGESVPRLLILTQTARFPFWFEQIARTCALRGRTLPTCAIADYRDLAHSAYAPIWLPLDGGMPSLGDIKSGPDTRCVSLTALCNEIAEDSLVERFSRYFTFQKLLLERQTGPLARHTHTLPQYVYESLQAEADQLQPIERKDIPAIGREIADEFYGTRSERTRMAALLTLCFTAQQKSILAALARHPWMALPDLQTHLQSKSTDPRLVLRQLKPLTDVQIAHLYPWPANVPWQEQERYALTEAGLRYLAARHGLPPAHYLCPPSKKQPGQRVSQMDETIRWVQRGAGDLKRQMFHTNGVYRCIRQITEAGRRGGAYEVLFWRSAREAIRWHPDMLGRECIFARPDAELLYAVRGQPTINRLLIEYDRGTTYAREYQIKLAAYADYQDATKDLLPPIVMIVQSQHTRKTIERVVHEVQASALPIVMILEHEVGRTGLQSILPQLLHLSRTP